MICNKCRVEKPIGDFYKNKKLNTYFKNCKECTIKTSNHRQKLNREKYTKLQREWRHRNKDHLKLYKYELSKEEKKCLQIRKSIKLAIKRARLNKVQRRKIKYLGCTGIEYVKYLESKFKDGMTWNNYGRDGWTIDHIKPECSFDFKDESAYYKCFNYLNTQPLWNKENQLKGKNF